jgi:hypothetical protein
LDYLYSLPFKEFLFCVEMANEGFVEDFKNGMYHASYTAWQINETIKGLFEGKSKNSLTFAEYTEKLGIEKKPETSEDKDLKRVERELEKQKALAIANEIIQLDRKGAQNG